MSNPVQGSSADVTSDPLLKPGAFIDPNGRNQSPVSSKPRNGSISNGAQTETPGLGPNNSSSSAEPKAKRRTVAPDTWLPVGWVVEERVRTNGATAGTTDTYYIEPTAGRRFRSKKEVLYFLETGSPPPKKKKGVETSGGNESSAGISAGNKQKKDKKPKPLNFDFINAPEKVGWLLTDASSDSWTPFLGDNPVLESIRQDWAAAFTSLTASKSGQAMF